MVVITLFLVNGGLWVKMKWVDNKGQLRGWEKEVTSIKWIIECIML